MNISKGLRMVLVALIKNDVITASWGISKIVIDKTSLSFDVVGLKYNGLITIKAFRESEYIIHIGDKVFTLYDINELVIFLDDKIEQTTNYISDLERWIAKR